MRDSNNVFHLAIPTHNLDLAQDFYIKGLGCKLARRYDDRMTIDFFGDQVVCHFDPEFVPEKPKMYPRHFGVTFKHRQEFDFLLNLAKERDLPFFQDLFVRFENQTEEHASFFLVDPSGNLLEFKHYKNPQMMY